MSIEEVKIFRVLLTTKHIETLMFLMRSADLPDDFRDDHKCELNDFQKLVEKVFTNARLVDN